jgi:hypothetical protein
MHPEFSKKPALIQRTVTFLMSVVTDLFTPAAKITCYHCGDKSHPRRTVYIQFDNAIRPVCCNGCATILRTVEELGMREEYLAHKNLMSTSHE